MGKVGKGNKNGKRQGERGWERTGAKDRREMKKNGNRWKGRNELGKGTGMPSPTSAPRFASDSTIFLFNLNKSPCDKHILPNFWYTCSCLICHFFAHRSLSADDSPVSVDLIAS